MALFGVSSLTYFVTRYAAAALGLALPPFAVLFILAFESLIIGSGCWGFRRVVMATSFAAVIVVISTLALERFARPVSPVLGNSTLLRHCFSKDTCFPGAVMARIRAAMHMTADPDYLQIIHTEAPLRISDIVQVLQTYAPAERRPAILPDTDWDYFAGYIALSRTGQWYAWPIGSAINEQQSSIVAQHIVDASTLRSGQVLIVAEPEFGVVRLEKKILEKVRARCSLLPLAQTRYNTVYRAESCRTDGKT